MCILLEHANHKELLTTTNNGVKTLQIAVTASKWEMRYRINILYYRYHGISRRTIAPFPKYVYLLVYILNTMIPVV